MVVQQSTYKGGLVPLSYSIFFMLICLAQFSVLLLIVLIVLPILTTLWEYNKTLIVSSQHGLSFSFTNQNTHGISLCGWDCELQGLRTRKF